MLDEEAMQRAITLGQRGRLTAPPNPWVGCVIVAGAEVVGEGYHRRPGGPHAEIEALRQAGDRARGATLYVSLEPCSHAGRTGPCVEAILGAGITRVVAALVDPDPRVAGGGVARLRASGVEVDVGVEADSASKALAPYLFHRLTGRAWCLVKTAVSIDGRTAAPDGRSRWITGQAARVDAHRLRAESQAVLVGSGTAIEDRPALTVRHLSPLPETQPLRVLCDARGRVPATGPLFDAGLAPTMVLTTAEADPAVRAAWERSGAEVVEVPVGEGDRGVDLEAVLEVLGGRGVIQVLVEGGFTLHGSLVRATLVNQLTVYVGAKLLGEQGRPLVGGLGATSVDDGPTFHLVGLRQLGDDVRLDYEYAKVAA